MRWLFWLFLSNMGRADRRPLYKNFLVIDGCDLIYPWEWTGLIGGLVCFDRTVVWNEYGGDWREGCCWIGEYCVIAVFYRNGKFIF
ncbi:hypothetical protein THOM_1150 [Trachipleistophora hominis]|uniref:Transposable element encoded protein n=1 Tax=Trachipleistophora hominis TaxID=72359 RepID=L7JXV5_TRAHO|nr:hypothetical protein THOM_1150 [Trachipleistophora hominis]